MNNQVQQVKDKAVATQVVTVFDFMKANQGVIERALPKHIGIDRFTAMFTIVIRSNPRISECTPHSLFGSLVQTAQLGLMPGNVNHCYYVPFNNKGKMEVQFILGYKGMVELVNRSREAAILSTEVVYQNDEFEYELGLNPRLMHRPTSGERGEIIGVYCVAKNLLANEKLFVYLKKEDIDKVRAASKAGASEYSPWVKWYSEMAKKTAIKRMCKLLPLSIDVQAKIEADETVKTTISPDIVNEKDETEYAEIAEQVVPTSAPSADEMAAMDKQLSQ